jgi:hypothetical protein
MRSLLAVALGAVLMVSLSVANIALMWFSLGWKFAFSGAGPEASPRWCIGMLVGGAVAALLGGVVCQKVAGQRATVPGNLLVLLAACLAIFGLVMRNSIETAKLPAGKVTGDLSFAEASEYAVSPLWFHLANCFVAPGCVWFSLKLVGRR